MADQFCYSVLKVVVGQICQNMGWHAVQSTPLEVLVDILHRYLLELPRTTHRYCEQFGRTEPNLDDLGLAFQDLNISLTELQEYIYNVDLIHPPFEIPKFPISRPTRLKLRPDQDAEIVDDDKEDEQSEKSINQPDDHLVQDGAKDEMASREESGNESSTLQHLLTTPNNQEESKNLLKRCPETNVTPPQLSKRARLMNDEELSNMNAARDLTSVFMTSGGVISPAREGKLPDAKTPQYAVPASASADSSDQASGNKQAKASTLGNPNDTQEKNFDGEVEHQKDGAPKQKASTNKKKPISKPKKLASNAKKSLNDSKSGVKKANDVSVINNGETNKGTTPEKPKKKSANKNSKSSKKASSKNADTNASKPILPGITPLGAKEPAESTESHAKDSENFAQIDDTIDSVIQQGCDSKKKKPDIVEEEDGQYTSIHETITDVIQRAMKGDHSFSAATAARKIKAKDVYDFSDSGGEGTEMCKKSKTDGSNTSAPVPPSPSPPVTPNLVIPSRSKKDKSFPEIFTKSMPETPTKSPGKSEGSSKSKKRKNRPTKAAKKEMPFSNLELQKQEKESEEQLSGMGGVSMKMDPKKEPSAITSPFHNPPGFPCRPPLPALGGFHPNHHTSFTTNLGPPPPAHQGSSSSSSSASHHPSMLSPQFYPTFGRPMPNLHHFGDLPFSRPSIFSSGLSSSSSPSSFSGMAPTPAHTPQPKFYSSSSNNNLTSCNVSSSAVSDHKPVVPISSSNNDKLSLDVQVTSSSFPKSQTSPTLVLSVKSEPPSSVSESPKVEIKSSIFSSAAADDSKEVLEIPAVLLKSKNESKAKSKEHKKEKKDKGTKKEKGKRAKEKKEKMKELKEMKEEPSFESIASSAKANPIPLEDERPPVTNIPKKEKGKGKDKKKNKAKEAENQQTMPSKDEPVQKIKLKIGLGGAGGGSKCYIQPSSPPRIEKEVKRPPTPPPPPVVKAAPEPKASTAPTTRGRKKGGKAGAAKTTPPKKGAAAAAAAVASTPDKASSSASSRQLITETVGTTVDEDGNKIWICPTCGRPDDGSAMIGCDSCDDWHHWICVKIVVPPKEEDSWFCARCISKQQEQLSARSKKKKKHKRDR